MPLIQKNTIFVFNMQKATGKAAFFFGGPRAPSVEIRFLSFVFFLLYHAGRVI